MRLAVKFMKRWTQLFNLKAFPGKQKSPQSTWSNSNLISENIPEAYNLLFRGFLSVDMK